MVRVRVGGGSLFPHIHARKGGLSGMRFNEGGRDFRIRVGVGVSITIRMVRIRVRVRIRFGCTWPAPPMVLPQEHQQHKSGQYDPTRQE